MTCDECDKIQDLAFDKNIPESTPIVYIRVGVSNVAIVACEKHAQMVIDALRGSK